MTTMSSTESHLTEYVHLLFESDPELEEWSALFDQARTNWDLPFAQHLLQQAKQHELSRYTRALVYQADGLLASQYGDLLRAIKSLQTSLHHFEELRKLQEVLFTYGQLGMLHRAQGELKTAIDYHSRQMVLASQLGILEWQVNSHKELGFDYYELGELRQADSILENGLKLAVAPEDIAELHNTIGLVAWQEGNPQKAVIHFEEALQRFQELELDYPAAQARANLGNIAYASDDIQQAIEYYTQALEIFNEMGVVFDKVAILNNLGGIAMHYDNFESAQMHFQESLILAVEMGDQIGEQNALINLGVIAMRQGNYPHALANYQKAFSMSKEIGNHSTSRLIYRKIAQLELIWWLESLRKLLKGNHVATWGESMKHLLNTASYFLRNLFTSS